MTAQMLKGRGARKLDSGSGGRFDRNLVAANVRVDPAYSLRLWLPEPTFYRWLPEKQSWKRCSVAEA